MDARPTAFATLSNVTFVCARSEAIASSIAAPRTTAFIWFQHFVDLLLVVAELTALLVHRFGLRGFERPQLLLRLLGPPEAKQRAAERIARLQQSGIERHRAAQHGDRFFVAPGCGFDLTEHAERLRMRGIEQRRREIFNRASSRLSCPR